MAIDPALFGMPTADTAGVQDGVTLTAYTGGTIASDNVVLENKIISGTLNVTGANVTIRNCLIQGAAWYGIDAGNSTAKNLTVEHCTFIGAGYSSPSSTGIAGQGTFLSNDISGYENGITLMAGSSTVKDNFIHDLKAAGADPHYDGISVQGGQNGVLIEHNTVISHDTSCIFIKNDFGLINDVTVRDNLLLPDEAIGPLAYSIAVDARNGPITNVVIENNYIEKPYYDYITVENASPTISGNILWNEGVDPTPYPNNTGDHFPNAVNDSASTDIGAPVIIDALINDTLGDTPTAVASFDHATANGGVVDFTNGKFTYTPAAGWFGTDTFNYVIQDTDGDTDSAVVSVVVKTPAPPPGQTFTGTSAGETITGTSGSDMIDGKGGHDQLYGGAGADKITGGTGNDDLHGGADADTFDFNAVTESPPGVGQRDLIWDFEQGVDKIDLSTIDAKTNTSGNQAFSFLGEGAFNTTQAKTPGLLKYHYETAADGGQRTVVEATVDTKAGVDFQVSLVGHHVLSPDDFIL